MILILELVDQTGLQTGFIVDCADWLQMRTGFEVIRSEYWHWLQPLIENKTRSVAQLYQVVDFKNSLRPRNQGDLMNNPS